MIVNTTNLLLAAGLPPPLNGLDSIKPVFNISKRTFDYICSLVEENMMVKTGTFSLSSGKHLFFHDQVTIALRRLKSGESLMTIGDSCGLHHSTVSQITWRFVEALEEKGLHHLHWPSSEMETSQIKSSFEKIKGLPNCCGVVNSTHILMCLPNSDSTNDVWLDRKKNYSMVLQGIVDHRMRFRDVVTGWPGKMDDSSIFRNSNFYKLCDQGERLNGKSLEISKGVEINEYIIGDSSYPLLPFLMTPFEGNELSEIRAEFNRRHNETLKVGRRAMARLKDMWKIIQGVMWRPDKHKLPRIILVCCLLHNIVIDMEDEALDEMPLSCEHDSGYSQQVYGGIDSKGFCMRENLSFFLSAKLPP